MLPGWNLNRSISGFRRDDTVDLETDVARALGRTRAFNHYARKIGLAPSRPGQNPTADTLKANAMNAVIPFRKLAGTMIRRVRQR